MLRRGQGQDPAVKSEPSRRGEAAAASGEEVEEDGGAPSVARGTAPAVSKPVRGG